MKKGEDVDTKQFLATIRPEAERRFYTHAPPTASIRIDYNNDPDNNMRPTLFLIWRITKGQMTTPARIAKLVRDGFGSDEEFIEAICLTAEDLGRQAWNFT